MDIMLNGKLNLQAFEMKLRQGTHDMNDALAAAAKTLSAAIESTHFLMALARIPGGITQKSLARLHLTTEQWESGLAGCAETLDGQQPPAHITAASLHESARKMLDAAKGYCAQYNLDHINEPVLLLSALKHVTSAVSELCQDADINLESWCGEIEKTIPLPKIVLVFNDDGTVKTDSFSPGARKVLNLLRSETESLGYEIADPRHLLLALLAHEGVTQYGLYQQGLLPRKLQEAAMLSLRSKARRTRSVVPPDRKHFQLLLQNILERAGKLAGEERLERIDERHILRALLALESTASRILADERVNISTLDGIAENYDVSQDDKEEEVTIADLDTIRKSLEEKIVGQDNAIERVLPYIQRMRFGFSTPGRPVGVFLFCGQSGSGKTEMAKALARAVYGSEDNLIFLEMGQFNTRESMNIFVGAPPGYVGYGEGKLTNGLRDRPRAVVLFDEVEKADSLVLDALLRFLDEGKIDDPAGPMRDGSQCLIILTSNISTDEISALWDKYPDDPSALAAAIRPILRKEFEKIKVRPEFLNRVDELILFRTLTGEHYIEIAKRLLVRDLERLRMEYRIEVMSDSLLPATIGKACLAVDEGARAAQRLTQSMVITPIIDFVLRQGRKPPVRLQVKSNPADPSRCIVEFDE
jgi:ATP-dependent Clp protease ATP-binding subunit ClpA